MLTNVGNVTNNDGWNYQVKRSDRGDPGDKQTSKKMEKRFSKGGGAAGLVQSVSVTSEVVVLCRGPLPVQSLPR